MAKEGKRDLSNVEFAEHPPKWVKPSDISFIRENEDIREVIRFFVVNSPCANVSARGIDLTQYNWENNNPQKGKYLYNRLLTVADLAENISLFIGEGVDKTKDLFVQAGMNSDFWSNISANRIALVPNGNLIMTIFKVIRNCFAHCRFTIIPQEGDYLVAMENGEARSNRFEVKARLVLKLSTLKEWIRIIQEDYAESEIYERQYENQIEVALFEVIKKNEYNDTDDMVTKVGFVKSDVEKVKKRLITSKIIQYSRQEKRWLILSEEKENEHTDS